MRAREGDAAGFTDPRRLAIATPAANKDSGVRPPIRAWNRLFSPWKGCRLKYVKRRDGEGWAIKNCIPFKIACCDCGLVHRIVIVSPKHRKGAVLGIAASRDERATAAKRRKK